MGIYTGSVYSGVGSSPSYDTVEPFALSEHYNYQDLGIIAAAESAMNRDMFMQAIGISEANSLAQYGSDSVFYESVDLGGIFKKIKMFFKKIIEKIQKIFHTFIAKMSAWFGNSKDFAKKYRTEIISNWGKIKKDLDFKGYKFSHIIKTAGSDGSSANVEAWKTKFTGSNQAIKDLVDKSTEAEIGKALDAIIKSDTAANANVTPENVSTVAKNTKEEITKFRSDYFDGFKDGVRKSIVDQIGNKSNTSATIHSMSQIQFDLDQRSGYDQKEFTEELFKAFRSGEDSKESLTKTEIEDVYGGGISGIISYLTDFDKIKTSLERCQKGMTNEIDKVIKGFDKAENDIIRNMDTANKGSDDAEKAKTSGREAIVQASVLVQDILGFVKEVQIQAFGAALQAQKEACSQAKEVCVMAIGLSKKVTEESYDYGTSGDFGSYANGLIESTVIH
jgi:hypothetical protein